MTRRMIRPGALRALLAGVAGAALALSAVVPAAADEVTSSITGTVTRESDASPVEGVGVFVSETGGGFSFNGYSDADGEYAVTDLPDGEYDVRFAPDGAAPDLISEYWNDAAEWSDAQRITVAGGETVADIDASLQTGGLIAGSVVRDTDGTAVEGATVTVSRADGSWSADLAWTQTDGTFLVGGLRSGEYVVRFDAPDGSGLHGEYWDDAAEVASATPVTVVAGETASDLHASLAEAAVISGHVTRVSDGTAVEGVVELWPAGERGGPGVPIETDGSYRISAAPGSYILHFLPVDPRLFPEFWEDAATAEEATVVTVASGEQRTAIDAELAAGTAISGTVRADGAPLADISVTAFDGDLPVGTTTTAWDGTYSLTLPVGTYVLSARAAVFEPIYATEFYENAATADEATPLTLSDDEDLTAVDFDLDLGADIRGTVSLDGAGAPGGEGATVTAYRWNGEEWVEAARTPSWGDFAFSPDRSRDGGTLLAGRYTFSVAMSGYCTQYFGGALTLDDAASFELAPGETVTGADVTLTADCETAPPMPALTLSAGSVRAGAEITVSGSGFAPGAKIAFELRSDPIALGTLTADAGGVLRGSFRIPASVAAGAHTLVALDADAVVIASAALRVTAPTIIGGGAADPDDALASTGTEPPTFAVAMAVALMLLGFVLVRRRRTQS